MQWRNPSSRRGCSPGLKEEEHTAPRTVLCPPPQVNRLLVWLWVCVQEMTLNEMRWDRRTKRNRMSVSSSLYFLMHVTGPTVEMKLNLVFSCLYKVKDYLSRLCRWLHIIYSHWSLHPVPFCLAQRREKGEGGWFMEEKRKLLCWIGGWHVFVVASLVTWCDAMGQQDGVQSLQRRETCQAHPGQVPVPPPRWEDQPGDQLQRHLQGRAGQAAVCSWQQGRW